MVVWLPWIQLKSLCLFASKETSARLSPLFLSKAVWKRADVATAVLLFGYWRHRKSAVIPFPGCAGRRLMHLILKVPEKSVPEFNVVSMAVGPNTHQRGNSAVLEQGNILNMQNTGSC
ncbi:hypothetical protein XENOCAPTIV_000962 [Xenoophorus captivus]|uniref:Secreted protein n=1 Tax=Xenoophorus captivus TaxID=1517983 RepID=A0ABV0Q3J9_9TELE